MSGSLRTFVSGYIVLAAVGLAQGGPFPDASQNCPDAFPSRAAVQVNMLNGSFVVLYDLRDPQTIIGRSSPHVGPLPLGGPFSICSGGSPAYPQTDAAVGEPCAFPEMTVPPILWFNHQNDLCRRQLNTEILSLNLNNNGRFLVNNVGQVGNASIHAGQPYFTSVNGTPQQRFYRNSIGLVASQSDGDENNNNICDGSEIPPLPLIDFPADSFFNVFFEVTAGSLKFYNKTPLVPIQRDILRLPPDLGLPSDTYIHDPSFGALPVFDENGLYVGSLLSAGHGGPAGAPDPPEEQAAPRLNSRVLFSVDDVSVGLDPAVTMATPHHVFDDGPGPIRDMRVYASSANQGSAPDLTNARYLVGTSFPAVDRDKINSISSGRDGTLSPFDPCGAPVPETLVPLYFSVSRTSEGIPCTNSDVWYNSDLVPTEAAADIDVVGFIEGFGKYSGSGTGLKPLLNHPLLATDQTGLGLRPVVSDPNQDNVTALELDQTPAGSFLSAVENGPFFTFVGPNYDPATIYYLEFCLAGPPFCTAGLRPGNLRVFSSPPDIGLGPDDIIDALALSDVTPGCVCVGGPTPGASCANSAQCRVCVGGSNNGLPCTVAGNCPGGSCPAGGSCTCVPPCPQRPNFVMDAKDPLSGVVWDEVLFSLAPGSPSLGTTYSPATIFYSNFDGTKSEFLKPEQLGLLLTDDVDAIDVTPLERFNDQCEDAEPITVPGLQRGSTRIAYIESNASLLTCGGITVTAPGVWYRVVGTGGTLTATTCSPMLPVYTNYDTKLSIYCGDCSAPSCVAANDDRPGPPEPACDTTGNGMNHGSMVSWCSTAGAEYLILVHGSGTATRGEFVLTVNDNGVSCNPTVSCALPTGRCCVQASNMCTVDTAPNCSAMGGNYIGDGLVCLTDADGDGVDDGCAPPPNDIVWNADPLSPDRTTRSLRFTVEAAVTATGDPGQLAIKVTMVDLAHPLPANTPASVTRRCSASLDLCIGMGQGNCPAGQSCNLYNFSAYDTRSNGVCVGGSHAGHHCDVDADCRVCVSGATTVLHRPCTSNADCGGGAGSCPAGGTCSSLTMCSAAGEAVPADASGQGGCARWVGEPHTFLESQDLPALGNYRAARLQCAPFYHNWVAETATFGPITVNGAEILPSSTYSVQVYAESCKSSEDSCTNVSAAVEMLTRRYGDVVGGFNPPTINAQQPDGSDVNRLVDKFRNQPGAPGKAISLIQPNMPELNGDVSGSDITRCVDAFRQIEYRFLGPCPCPSQAVCGALACPSSATVCAQSALPGLGRDATCVRTCTGGDNDGDPCVNNSHCPGGGTCGNPFCRDRCGRCTP